MTFLEKMPNNELKTIKRLGFFLGSFDPLHAGHIEVIKIVIEQKLCDSVLVYCVQGESDWKRRSSFAARTAVCEKVLNNIENVIISYMSPFELQQKLTVRENSRVKSRFSHRISAIIGADIACALEYKNGNPKIEEARIARQVDFMRGVPLSVEYKDSLACSIALPADDFVVALRDDYRADDVPTTICGRPVSALIDTHVYRNISSTKIRRQKQILNQK